MMYKCRVVSVDLCVEMKKDIFACIHFMLVYECFQITGSFVVPVFGSTEK